MNKYNYDLVLSFAGEDRDFVEKCAEIFRALGINIFYDNYEQHNLLGKDLFAYLGDIYQNQAQHAVIFVSKFYKQKHWTNHELKFMAAREFVDNEYILPVLIDDTHLQQIPLTTGYIEAKTPLYVASTIAKKLKKDFDIYDMLSILTNYLPDYKISIENSNVIFDCEIESFYAEYPLGLMMEFYRNNLIYEAFIVPEIVPN